jgi:beta-glucosidase
MITFPPDFLWGAASSSHQVEGNNTNNDWWEWETSGRCKERSLAACRHYERFEEDFDLAASLGHNAHRLSIEWSRIEPQASVFSDEALRHYRRVLTALRARNIEPVVTLYHFTLPVWLSRAGGWEYRRSVEYFERFTRKVVSEYADLVRYWVTINEPLVYVCHAYLWGYWPPGKKSVRSAYTVVGNLARAHKKAYRVIHGMYREKELIAPWVSIAKNLQAFEPATDSLRDKIGVWLRDYGYNHRFLADVISSGTLDYIGVNYYSRQLVKTRDWSFQSLAFDQRLDAADCEKNALGWDIYPAGLLKALGGLRKFLLPVMVTENGICTADDGQRWRYIRAHLEEIKKALDCGVRIIGYLYWSLTDNFEWDKGFAPRFGLVDIDYATGRRTIRESGRRYSRVCTTGELE